MRRKTLYTLVACAIGLLAATLAIAGSMYSFKCANPACGFGTEISFGGGFRFAQVTGYCTTCKDFVSLTWDRPQPGKTPPQPEPKPAGKVWCPETGRSVELFKCPKCSQPVLTIQSGEDIKACPRCGKPGPKVQRTIMFD